MGRDREQLGHVAAGEFALETVLLLEHPHGTEGQAVHGAAGDVGGKTGPGLELGTLVVGNVQARGRVGLGKEFEGGGLAGAGESEDAQRAGGIGVAGRDDGILLGAGLQGDLLASCRQPRIGRSGCQGRSYQIAGSEASEMPDIQTRISRMRRHLGDLECRFW